MTEEKKAQRDPEVEYQAGSAIVDEGMFFKIPFWFGTKLKLTVKPLKPGTIVKISQVVTLLKKIDDADANVQEALRSGANLKAICRILALGCTNSRWKIAMLSGWLSRVLLWRVPNTQELFAYLSLVYRQVGAQHFFFIMALTGGMNFLEKKTTTEQEKTGEEKASGVR